MRKFLRLSYSGESFHGWQRQPDAISVQQTIEEALSTVLRLPVSIVGAGRTDTGVNARMMYAHFDTEFFPEDNISFLRSLNRLVGPGIAVNGVYDVPPDAHARFDALSRTYKYFISYAKSPFINRASWFSPSQLSMEEMNAAAKMLVENLDFTSFAKLHSNAKTNICHLSEAYFENWVSPYGDEGLVFTISADRFLRNMVRAVVGTLVEVGRGKLSCEGFKAIIDKRNRCEAGTSMPPQALFLWDIRYPESYLLPS